MTFCSVIIPRVCVDKTVYERYTQTPLCELANRSGRYQLQSNERWEMSQPLNIDIYLDYICPWCYIASARLFKLKEEYEERIVINWKSFLLDPHGLGPNYVARVNESRLRAGMEERSLHFEPWPEDKALPDSSMPAHEAAKCAQMQGREAFEHYHMTLMKAYSSDCKDIISRQVLVSLAEEVQLDVKRFISDLESDIPKRKVLLEYEEAMKKGSIVGVPTVIIGERAVLEATVPLEVYKRAVQRLSK